MEKIKCLNCGSARNVAGTTFCVGCGYPLPVVSAEEQAPINVVSKIKNEEERSLAVVASKELTTDEAVEIRAAEGIKKELMECIRCNYIMRVGQTLCPNCGHDNVGFEEENEAEAAPVIEDIVQNSSKKKAVASIEDFEEADEPIAPKAKRKEKKMSAFSLHQVSKGAGKSVVHTGKSRTIGQEDIDPTDPTITPSEHLLLEYEDGRWYLSDRSANGAVFIQVKGKMPLENGQLLLVGQKKFYRFTDDSPHPTTT